MCLWPVPSGDLSHGPYKDVSVIQASDRDLFSEIARFAFYRAYGRGLHAGTPTHVKTLGGRFPNDRFFVVFVFFII